MAAKLNTQRCAGVILLYGLTSLKDDVSRFTREK